MKILLVDDNASLAAVIRDVLEDDGQKVVYAKDGVDGCEAYLAFQPDLVITDIQMPRKNGLEMMRYIRNHNPLIRTVYMSGDIRSYEQELREEERRYPVSYVEKPFLLESLRQAVAGARFN